MRLTCFMAIVGIFSLVSLAQAQDVSEVVKLQAENKVLRTSANQWAARAEAAEKAVKDREAELAKAKADIAALQSQLDEMRRDLDTMRPAAAGTTKPLPKTAYTYLGQPIDKARLDAL